MDYFGQHLLDDPDAFFTQLAELNAPVEGEPEVSKEAPTPVGTPRGEAPGVNAISISTAFHLTANLSVDAPDLVLISADGVFFHVHRHILQDATINHFNSTLLAQPKLLRDLGFSYVLDDSAEVLNVLLHTLYNKTIASYIPSITTLIGTIDALPKYGIPFDRFLAPNTPLFTYILTQAPLSPMQVYIAAAKHGLEALAVPASGYLLSYPLPNVTDEMCKAMGAVYFRRLVMLHVRLNDEFRKLMLTPPSGHEDAVECGFVEQKKLVREWALATSDLSWQVRPDFSVSLLQATLGAIHTNITCHKCKESLNTRIRQLLLEWTLTKRTI